MNVSRKNWSPTFVEEQLLKKSARSFLRPFFRNSTSEVSDHRPKPISYAEFARRAGVRSRSYILDVLEGRKPLTTQTVNRICLVLGFKGAWREYFETLVLCEKKSATGADLRKLKKIKLHLSKRADFQPVLSKGDADAAPHLASTLTSIYAASGTETRGSTLEEILARTRIPEALVRSGVRKLEELGLLLVQEGRHFPRKTHLAHEALGGSEHFRRDYIFGLDKTRASFLAHPDSQRKLFFSSTVCIDLKKMPEYSKRLRELLYDFVLQIEDSEGDAVLELMTAFHDSAPE